MTLYEMKQMEREEGRKEGLDQGRIEGKQEGIQEGIKEGMQKGKIRELLDMVSDGLISYDVAARRAKEKYDIKEGEFQKMLTEHQANKNS